MFCLFDLGEVVFFGLEEFEFLFFAGFAVFFGFLVFGEGVANDCGGFDLGGVGDE